MTSTSDHQALLRRFNPLLVILPQDPTRHRPWSRWYQRVTRPRGDYHPCSAEYFLSFAYQRDHPKRWNPLSFTEPALPEPTGIAALKAKVASTGPNGTSKWELDLAPLRSQDPDHAWTAHALMLQQADPAAGPRVYARYVPGPRPVLQYWYLYVYNDAPNKHEGDWESVVIELDEAREPARAGYAGHASGFRRPWSRVERVGDRPVVYVSRGSHAAYFEHRPGGHRTNSLPSSKGWIAPLESAWGAFNRQFQDTMGFLRLVDHTAAHDAITPSSPDLGVVIDPEPTFFPDLAASDAPPPDFWWMNINCLWGSRHSRLSGTIGPAPPWLQLEKWQTPSAWLDTLVDDD